MKGEWYGGGQWGDNLVLGDLKEQPRTVQARTGGGAWTMPTLADVPFGNSMMLSGAGSLPSSLAAAIIEPGLSMLSGMSVIPPPPAPPSPPAPPFSPPAPPSPPNPPEMPIVSFRDGFGPLRSLEHGTHRLLHWLARRAGPLAIATPARFAGALPSAAAARAAATARAARRIQPTATFTALTTTLANGTTAAATATIAARAARRLLAAAASAHHLRRRITCSAWRPSFNPATSTAASAARSTGWLFTAATRTATIATTGATRSAAAGAHCRLPPSAIAAAASIATTTASAAASAAGAAWRI